MSDAGGHDWDLDPELWEHQGRRLTVGELRQVLDQVPDDVRFVVELYDGSSRRTQLLPTELGAAGKGSRPTVVVLTVLAGFEPE